MAEEMWLIDANKICKQCRCQNNNPSPCSICGVKRSPTVDAVPVTRCKDCDRRWNFNGALYCNHARGPAGIVEPDHFCSYGERKT